MQDTPSTASIVLNPLNPLPNGYYGADSLLLLLAFMALCRLDNIEATRYSAPGEWGKLLGLDRIPEVRTLRAKLVQLSANGAAARWSAQVNQFCAPRHHVITSLRTQMATPRPCS